jgi:predicted nucleic acid-binding protein|tara:strand:- start:391 stop:1011 length:621 start_codon:yes stop_codon:yes gene_type:complete
MKKTFVLLTFLLLLVGCIESMALLGPASSVIGGGNVVHSTASSAINYAVKKKTGKSPMQHVVAYAEEKNPNKEKKRCISFVEKTNSEACAIAKKQVVLTHAKLKKKTKSVFKTIPLINKFIDVEKASKTIVTPRGQIFSQARKEGKDYFVFQGKIYHTRLKETAAEKIITPKNLLWKKNKNKDLVKSKKSAMELALEMQTALRKNK